MLLNLENIVNLQKNSTMTEALLYQSILQKLGQVSPNGLPEVEAFLTLLVSRQTKSTGSSNTKKTGKQSIAHLFGAWEDWDEHEFQAFLAHIQEVRANLFSSREI
jgi:hypothetical protein